MAVFQVVNTLLDYFLRIKQIDPPAPASCSGEKLRTVALKHHMILHLKLLRLFVKREPFIVVDVYSMRIVRSVVAHVHIFVVVGASNFHKVICHSLVVAAIRVPIRVFVCSAQGLALAVKLAEIVIVAVLFLTTMLGDSQSANDSVILGEVTPILMRQQMSNLQKGKKIAGTNA